MSVSPITNPAEELSTVNCPLSIDGMNIVIVGHVDHGKSTVIGRLLADTGSLPEGKLEQVKRNCARNAKPFEYAFLLDALKDEQKQGITIDTARCFFKTAKRHYIIIDAPGHIEFLKNMISGAARAEAALLVIDAHEGVQENSRRHGFMLSLLGIDQIVVLINKMDLVGYRREVFEQIKEEYRHFLKQIKVEPLAFIPVSAQEGENLTRRSERMQWYQGSYVLERIDAFQKEKTKEEQPFRMPIQDVYRFTEDHDERRIFAGTAESGTIKVGDEVVFLPSFKRSVIHSIEGFNAPPRSEISAGAAAGFTLETQIYVKPGELMCRVGQSLPKVGTDFKANIFWMGKQPMLPGKKYKLKLATSRATVSLLKIERVLDAAALQSDYRKEQIDRHDVAECFLQTAKPIAFDLSRDIEATGRFVIIENYEIVGGGIIIADCNAHETGTPVNFEPWEAIWEKSNIPARERALRFDQNPALVIVSGGKNDSQLATAKMLEEKLFQSGYSVYYLGVKQRKTKVEPIRNEEYHEGLLRYLGQLAAALIGAGLICITNLPRPDEADLEILRAQQPGIPIFILNLDDVWFSKNDRLESVFKKTVDWLSQNHVRGIHSITVNEQPLVLP